MLQVQERPDPPVGAGEVRIDVKAAGINFADTMARVGLYPEAPKPPCVVGYEVAGDVESVGDGVESVKVGDKVMAGTRFGGQASMVTVPENQVFPLPDGFSYEQGAAFPVNYSTSYVALVMMGGLREGDRVLIHAAAGGVGISATQIARSRGAEIFGTASASKHDAIREQGVQHAIDYRNQDFAQEIRRITGGEGVDVIMDATGPTNFRKDYRLLREGGRLIMYGLSEASTGTGRDMKKVFASLARMPFATVPWWKSLQLDEREQGHLRAQHARLAGPGGARPRARSVQQGARCRRDLDRSGGRGGFFLRTRWRGPYLHRRAPEHRQGRARSLRPL